MRKIVMAALASVAIVAPAEAQFTRPAPPILNDKTILECSPTNRDANDRDPVYKINVLLLLKNGDVDAIDAIHTTVSGKMYVRSEQYKRGTVWKTKGLMEWFWRGDKGSNTMVGEVWRNDNGWWYSEKHYEYNQQNYQMNAACHELDLSNDNKGDAM